MAKKTAPKKSVKKSPARRAAKSKRSNPQPVEQYPLRITAQQYGSLRYQARIKPKLIQRISQASSLSQTVLVSRDELDYLYHKLCENARFSTPDTENMLTVLQQVIKLSDEVYEKRDWACLSTNSLSTLSPGKGKAKKSDLPLLQFKITLQGIKPFIWRRIQVPDCNLGDFHMYLQAAFGWENAHMHQFVIDGQFYGMQFDVLDPFDLGHKDETQFRLSQFLPRSHRPCRWIYEYDFGDSWIHEIVFEDTVQREARLKYPRCTEGARACPPEDCGGVWGYADLLAVLSHPEEPEHEEMLEWYGTIDPDEFEAKKATKMMHAVGKKFPK